MSHRRATLTNITQNDKAVLCLVRDCDGKVVMTIDEKVTYSGLYLAGDQVIYAHKKGERQIQNLSCQVLRLSRFRRNLSSLLRNLVNEQHPLNRVLVINKKADFCCMPHDEQLRHDHFKCSAS
jgi:hypothetical protein